MVSYKYACPDATATLRNTASTSSTGSDSSDRTKSTAPTIYSEPLSKRQEETEEMGYDDEDLELLGSASSASTLGSTSGEEDDVDEPPLFSVTDRNRPDNFTIHAMPSSSSTFSKLFPSCRRLLIRHDDSTLDGNMNLRVDTMVPHRSGHEQGVVLFHLRMYDLFTRRFSLRRYSRVSGREICNSRRAVSTSEKAPTHQRSWSSVLASLRPGSGGHRTLQGTNHKRRGSEQGEFFDDGVILKSNTHRRAELGDTILLEFSNYAHVELKRRGPAVMTQRYGFEYWGTKYQWRRESHSDLREVSYHLINLRTSKKVAHLLQEVLTPTEANEEENKGGWIPPSSMWISDMSAFRNMHDVADVIVATGLMVLVDDCIRRRWHRSGPSALIHSRSFFSSQKRLVDGIFHRS
ncbi:uncharacterized protein DSM5745_09007 [Aspergillus mulundensis]|uniref:Uncharacterized protein n=1 Tax=Aspergillus mulundensis TaxID=1810919 RepID=A0A3D8QZP9_9EURO|nr:Uncharacterized protein DSM5745_09007 [Aspergillus mulundensis]RDW67141.1 Uncharacterized protein DSM5745_09007 [Aspergillus mulundensis]